MLDTDLLNHCEVCDIDFCSEEELELHAYSPGHRLSFLQDYYSSQRSDMILNKCGVLISVDDPDNRIDTSDSRIDTPNNRIDTPQCVDEDGKLIIQCLKNSPDIKASIYICNESSDPVVIENIEGLYHCNRIVVSDDYGITQHKSVVKLDKECKYEISFTAIGGEPCVQELPLVFEFSSTASSESFYILRILVIEVLEALGENETSTPLKDRKTIKMNMQIPPPSGSFEKGILPKGEKSRKGVFEYYYPASLRMITIAKFRKENIVDEFLLGEMKRIRQLMYSGLRYENYKEWFRTQLWLEEIQKEIDLMRYHQINVKVFPLYESVYSGGDVRLVKLHVPGLPEKRPGLLISDSLFFRRTGQAQPIYEGIVHQIQGEFVHLGFNNDFYDELIGGLKVDVQFWFNRQSFVRSHKALDHCHHILYLLFPPKSLVNRTINKEIKSVSFYDERVYRNAEQKQAVDMIVNEVSKPYPYILFGPPGTGKTLTMVEAIKQVYRKPKHHHILVCGPSNSACDMITERLLTDIPPNHIKRVNAASRCVRTISSAVRQVSSIQDGVIMFPSIDMISTYRIVVSTFTTAAKIIPVLCNKGDIRQGFAYLFLDECGHGQEPEALIPLLSLADQVVLAGDPKQLGPVIFSSYCKSNSRYFKGAGLDQSLLERLMNTDPYRVNAEGKFNKMFVTKLLDNFRSHERILEIPNKLFYDSELRAKADKSVVNALLNFKELPNKNIPIIFNGVNGRDSREKGNPSYFNDHEVSEVVQFVKKINKRVKLEDIGIITPYKTQIHKIRKAMRTRTGFSQHDLENLRIGSPEEFQGDERQVIIVSTVRASAEHLLCDNMMQLGFLRNPKRFNVIITRAKAMLVVIGCPWLLVRDIHWGALLMFAKKNGCYMGCPYDSMKSKEIDEIYENYKRLNIDVGEDVIS